MAITTIERFIHKISLIPTTTTANNNNNNNGFIIIITNIITITINKYFLLSLIILL